MIHFIQSIIHSTVGSGIWTRTDLAQAVLTDADLRGVDLRDVRGLTIHQIRTARIDERSQLPLRLRILQVWDQITQIPTRRDGSSRS
jgi:hypothetical protein